MDTQQKIISVTLLLFSRGDHRFCHSKDINMFCSDNTFTDPTDNVEKFLCRCRPDMEFDTM